MSALSNLLMCLVTNSIICVISGPIFDCILLFCFLAYLGRFALTSDLVDVVETGFYLSRIGLELPLLPVPSSKFGDYRRWPLCSLYAVLGMEPRDL